MRWLTSLFSRRRRYDDLTVSMDEHLDEKIEELMEEGASREEAQAAARREFGNMTLLKERSREVWQWSMLESFWADAKFAARQLKKSPGFTATAVLTLSLGIAVNATMFSLVSAFLLGHLPGQEPDRVVVVTSVRPEPGDHADINPVSAPNYLAWRKAARSFSEMAAADEDRTGSLTGHRRPKTIQYAAVSSNYFKVLGARPWLGRLFSAEEDRPGRGHVAILSYGLWASRFGSDRSVVGRKIRLNREDYVVAGVMPAEFRLLGFLPQLWTPLVLTAADETAEARKERSLYVFARLTPGATLQAARGEMEMLAKRAQAEMPLSEARWGAAVRTLSDFVVYNFGIRSALAVFMTTVSFILLIACANVAGLLLTRAVGRQKEVAIRLSIGASRGRIVRQLVTEGLVIAVLGGSAGLLLTVAGVRLLRAGLHFNEAISAVPVTLDSHVLWFVVIVSLASAVLSSVVPAWKAARTDVNIDLKSESRASSGGRLRSRLRGALAGGEIALALFLLTGTSLLIRGVFLLDHQELGFRTDHLLTAGITLDAARYGDETRQRGFASELISRLQRLQGSRVAAIASDLPATDAGRITIGLEGEAERPANEQRIALHVVVTPDYFQAIGIPVLRGRAFSDADRQSAPRAALVNQEFVRRYLKGKDAVGMRIKLNGKGTAPGWSEVVGVMGDVKSYSEETRVDPEVYEAFVQRPVTGFSVIVRTDSDPDGLALGVRRVVAGIDAELPLDRVMSMDAVIEGQRNGNPLFSRVLGIFALLALVLAAIGIYGLAAYSVGQRTHEIGIRIAVGARTPDILRMILREGLRTAGVGAVLGLMLAVPLPRVLDAMFVGIEFDAPAVHAMVLAAILAVASLAIYIPALRATRIDPKVALRS